MSLRILFLIVILTATGLGATAAPLRLSACEVAGVSRPALCGTLEVPENRDTAHTRSLWLTVMVVKAPAQTQGVPVLFFAGGPGQGAAAMAATILRDLDAVAPTRDIILVDQRGTGTSHSLACDGGFLLAEPRRAADLRRCRQELEQWADLDRYGTDESADDAAAVVRALGHRRVDVVGASYGTRLARYFMQRHPSLVRTAVLRAVAPAEFNILRDGARHAQAGLARLLRDCEADAACGAAFPDLSRDLEHVRVRLRREPSPLSLAEFNQTIYALLLSTPTRQMLPWLIHTAATGNSAPLLSVSATVRSLYKTVSVGAYLSVVCREDAPFASTGSAATSEFDGGAALMAAACQQWPTAAGAIAKRHRLPHPTLIVSGALDPVMPPVVGEQALGEFSQGQHLVLPATSHGPLFPGCATDIVRTFMATGGTPPDDVECVNALVAPPFRTKSDGSPPQ